MEESNLLKNNRGFTLVELLVSLLVSSMVILSASLFLSATIRTYNYSNTEVSLQMESQIALNLLENLVIESTECEYDDAYVYQADSDNSYVCTLFEIYSTDESGNSILYLIIHDAEDSMLLLKKLDLTGGVSADDIKNTVKEAIEAEKPALLANYVTKLKVSPASLDTDTEGLVRIDIELEYNDKTYTSSTSISLRNGVHR